jgi:LPS export ABC transporter protein LptC
MNKKNRIFASLFPGIIMGLLFLFSACENDVKTVNMLTISDTLAVEIITDIEVVQSEGGVLSFILTGPLLEKYDSDDPYIVFPNGVKIIFYDSLENIRSELSANYGISYEKKKIMEAKNNVVVINHQKNERLNTECLIWDRTKKLITSDVFVKITTENQTIYGENGMEADERFESWKLKKVRGDILVKDDDY